ncbi:MAG TPA: competence protein ComEA [Fastidiosipila sp.]|nr:competence protein ComEA [Fastidiosipila sp.]
MDKKRSALPARAQEKLSKLWLLPIIILIAIPVWIFWPKNDRLDLTVIPLPESETEAIKQTPAGSSDDEFHSILTIDEREHFPVYLTGAVYLPGLYYVPDGTILADVVEEAGGLREDAARDQINLAMKVLAHQMFYIPTITELADDPGLLTLIKPLPGTPSDKVNINTADESLLMKLPGIGPATAGAIIRYREENGPFQKPSDLMKVSGIKKTKFEGLEMYITAP